MAKRATIHKDYLKSELILLFLIVFSIVALAIFISRTAQNVNESYSQAASEQAKSTAPEAAPEPKRVTFVLNLNPGSPSLTTYLKNLPSVCENPSASEVSIYKVIKTARNQSQVQYWCSTYPTPEIAPNNAVAVRSDAGNWSFIDAPDQWQNDLPSCQLTTANDISKLLVPLCYSARSVSQPVQLTVRANTVL